MVTPVKRPPVSFGSSSYKPHHKILTAALSVGRRCGNPLIKSFEHDQTRQMRSPPNLYGFQGILFLPAYLKSIPIVLCLWHTHCANDGWNFRNEQILWL
jgi:hypothetical protein